MKLISCYIEGYGAIEKKDILFNEGITAFCQENGTGKTTLASFIKAMFYGLKGYKKGSTEFCDREHFYPFKGGKFGGNLTFSYNGKIYKIERYFGEKNTTGDTLKVYLDGELTDELGEEIGKTVFGVDEDSFMRTLFIGSEEIEIKSTSSINAKLGSFLQGMDEETGYDDAVESLKDACKSYQADRRSKNPTERIPVTEREIEELRAEIENAKRVQAALEEKYDRAEGLRTEIAELDGRIVTATEENERRRVFERYEAMKESIADKERQAQEILRRYPLGLPTEEETLIVEESIAKQKKVQAQAFAAEFSVKDEEKLSRLEECFVRGVPTEEDMLEVEKSADECKALETELLMLSSQEATAREKALSQKFMYECPTEAQIAEISVKVEAHKQAKKEYEAETEGVAATTVFIAEKNASRFYPLFVALATILCAVGAVCLMMEKASLGIPLLVVGGGILLFSTILSFNGKQSRGQEATMSALNPEKQQKERAFRELEYSIKAILTRYGYHSDNGVAYDFAQLQDDVKEYAQYVENGRKKECLLAEKRAKKQLLEDKLTAFFRAYGLTGNRYGALLGDLRANIREYDSLRERKKAQGEVREGLDKELEEARIKVEAYKKKYGLSELSISDILLDIREERRLRAELEREKMQEAAFKEKESLVEKPIGERVEIDALQAERTEKQNELGRLDREIDTDESVVESIDEKEAKLNEVKERLALYKQKHKLLKAAKEFLEKADGNLKDKYVKPIRDDFLRYADILEKTLGEKVVMTKNFEIRFEREGEQRTEKHLSAGQRSICALCFRLALIKNMYKENTPFLILDDPFVNLDSTHMEKVKSLLQALCKEMQMVYFTCHESRRI